jgi:hypothetical protein
VRLSVVPIALLALFARPISAQDTVKDHPYFPLKPGWQWTYRASGDQRVVLRMAGLEKVGDTLCAVLETKRPDGLPITEHVAVKTDGVYRYKAMRLALDPALCILKFPLKPGTKWTLDAKIGADTLTGNSILDDAEAVVPAGKFAAKRVTTELDRGQEKKFTIVSYFARDFGMVKQEQDLAGKTIMLELEKYEMAK